jgi:hypothetical protein
MESSGEDPIQPEEPSEPTVGPEVENFSRCETSNTPDHSSVPKRTVFENIESISKSIGAVGVPIAIAAIGWLIQSSLNQQSVSKDYVTLVIQILERKSENPVEDRDLKKWAVALLNRTAPVELDQSTGNKLANSELILEKPPDIIIPKPAYNPAYILPAPDNLPSLPLPSRSPTATAVTPSGNPKEWFGPDDDRASSLADGTFTTIDPKHGQRMLVFYLGSRELDVVFSSDGSKMLVSDEKHRVHLIDTPAAKETLLYEANTAISHMEFSANDTEATIRTDGDKVHSVVLP